MIPEFAEALAGHLGFDRSLSRAVRQEVEDHLWEAAAAELTDDPFEAQRRAIAKFGDPKAIAREIAAAALARSAKGGGVAAVLMSAIVFVAMKARLTWYAMAHCPPLDRMASLGSVVAAIDRYAFWSAVCASVAGWLYVSRHRALTTHCVVEGRRLRRFLILCWGATAALIASVFSDGVLTALRLAFAGESADWSIPVASMAIEIGCAIALVVCLRGIGRRATYVARSG